MVTHMVFTSPVFFLDIGAVVWGELCEAVLGSSLAAGPLVIFVLGLLLFFLLSFVRDEEESELVAAVVSAVAGPDGVAPPPPPPPSAFPLGLRDEEAAAVADEEDDEDDEDDEDVARSRVHRSDQIGLSLPSPHALACGMGIVHTPPSRRVSGNPAGSRDPGGSEGLEWMGLTCAYSV